MMDEPWLEPYVPMKGRTFIDVGANHGAWSHWLAPGYKRVQAIEPNPDCWPYLKGDNINLHKLAAWSNHAYLVFGEGPRDCFIPEDVDNYFGVAEFKTAPIASLTLDDLMITEIDFIKIDVEGAEKHVIQGAPETIRKWRPPMIIEIHHALNDTAIRGLLPDYSFRVIEHPFHHDAIREHHYWLVATPQ